MTTTMTAADGGAEQVTPVLPGALGQPWPVRNTSGTVTWLSPEQLDELPHHRQEQLQAWMHQSTPRSVSGAGPLEWLVTGLTLLAAGWTLPIALPRVTAPPATAAYHDQVSREVDRLAALLTATLDGLLTCISAARFAVRAHFGMLLESQYAAAAAVGGLKADVVAEESMLTLIGRSLTKLLGWTPGPGQVRAVSEKLLTAAQSGTLDVPAAPPGCATVLAMLEQTAETAELASGRSQLRSQREAAELAWVLKHRAADLVERRLHVGAHRDPPATRIAASSLTASKGARDLPAPDMLYKTGGGLR